MAIPVEPHKVLATTVIEVIANRNGRGDQQRVTLNCNKAGREGVTCAHDPYTHGVTSSVVVQRKKTKSFTLT